MHDLQVKEQLQLHWPSFSYSSLIPVQYAYAIDF